MKTGTLRNESTGKVVGARIRVAETSLTRIVGLLGEGGLEAGEGVWIRPSSGIHTFGMRFAIDAIGLDAELRVVRLWRALKPHRVPLPARKVRSVVELAAGQIEACGIGVGDTLRFTSESPDPA